MRSWALPVSFRERQHELTGYHPRETVRRSRVVEIDSVAVADLEKVLQSALQETRGHFPMCLLLLLGRVRAKEQGKVFCCYSAYLFFALTMFGSLLIRTVLDPPSRVAISPIIGTLSTDKVRSASCAEPSKATAFANPHQDSLCIWWGSHD